MWAYGYDDFINKNQYQNYTFFSFLLLLNKYDKFIFLRNYSKNDIKKPTCEI